MRLGGGSGGAPKRDVSRCVRLVKVVSVWGILNCSVKWKGSTSDVPLADRAACFPLPQGQPQAMTAFFPTGFFLQQSAVPSSWSSWM